MATIPPPPGLDQKVIAPLDTLAVLEAELGNMAVASGRAALALQNAKRAGNADAIAKAQAEYDDVKLNALCIQAEIAAVKAEPKTVVPFVMPAPASSVKLVPATSIEPESIDWLWHSHLARGKLTILAGVAGTGKSTVAFNLAATVSTGGIWPDGSVCPAAGNVLIWSGEDDPADTIIPRLMAASAALGRVHIITGGKDADGSQLPFDPANDVPRLREEIARIGGASLMIIDPIVSAVSGDMHRANDVRRGLQAVIDLSAEFDCSVMGISHFAKGSKGASPQERVIGSQAFAALARLVLVCAKTEDSDIRALARAKSNISLDHGGFNYTIEPATIETAHGAIDTTKVVWGEALEGNARDILNEMEGEADGKDDKSAVCLEAMRAILCGSDGNPMEMLCTEVQAQLKTEGHTPKVIRIARERLKVIIRRDGFGKGAKVYWRLPSSAMTVAPPMIPPVPGV